MISLNSEASSAVHSFGLSVLPVRSPQARRHAPRRPNEIPPGQSLPLLWPCCPHSYPPPSPSPLPCLYSNVQGEILIDNECSPNLRYTNSYFMDAPTLIASLLHSLQSKRIMACSASLIHLCAVGLLFVVFLISFLIWFVAKGRKQMRPRPDNQVMDEPLSYPDDPANERISHDVPLFPSCDIGIV